MNATGGIVELNCCLNALYSIYYISQLNSTWSKPS